MAATMFRPATLFSLVILALCAAAISAIAPQLAAAITMPQTVEGVHADLAHPIDGPQARNACKTYGVSQIWKQTDGRLHLLCQTPSNGWYDVIVNFVNGKYEEVSAFQPKDGTLSNVLTWIKGKGAKWISLEGFKFK